MSFTVHGLAVSRGIAIGRAVIVASSRMDVAHYFVKPDQVTAVIPTVQGRRDIVGRLHERVDPRGRPYFWIGPLGHHTKEYPETGTDIVAMREHKISVTPIGMDMTHYKTLDALRDGEFK